MLGLLQPTKTKFIFFKYWNPILSNDCPDAVDFWYHFDYHYPPSSRISANLTREEIRVFNDWFDIQYSLYKRHKKLSKI